MSHEQPGLKLIEIHQPLTRQGVEPKKVSVPDLVKTFLSGKDKHWPLLLPYFEKPQGVVIAIKSRGKNK
jgi:hypothetical protein